MRRREREREKVEREGEALSRILSVRGVREVDVQDWQPAEAGSRRVVSIRSCYCSCCCCIYLVL